MSSQSKMRTVFSPSAGSSSSDKQQVVHRPRGIPPRVYGNNDGKLDVNRNMQSSSSLTNSASSNFSSTNNNILQNINFENESAQSGKIAMLKRGLCFSNSVNSVKTLTRTKSPNRSFKCDNQSPSACLLASSNDNDVNKSAKKGRPSTSAVDASELRFTDKHRIESRSLANHCASYDIPSKLGHSKQLLINKNKNLSKILSSEETSFKKCNDSNNSHAKISVSVKEISHETDTMMPQGVHGIRLAKESFTGKLSMTSNSAKKPNLKPSCSDVMLSSGMTSHRRAFEKSHQRSGTKMPRGDMLASFNHCVSSPSTVSHQSSASNKQLPLKNDSRKQSSRRKSSESVSIESSVGLNERRKSSENSGHGASELSEQGKSLLHVSSDRIDHSATSYQSLPTGIQGKSSKTAQRHDIGIDSNLSSERSDLLGQELIPKTSVQRIPVSHASCLPENRQATMISDVSFHADRTVTCRTSAASANDEKAHKIQESLHEGKLLEDNTALNGRVFHTWRHRCSADSGGQLNTRSRPDSVVNDSGSERLDFDNRQDKETRSVESGDVVLDAETFQEMIDELKTLKLTILHLQRMLLQICTSESSIHNNDIVDANGSARMQHSPDSQELQKRVNELEKLAWEQRRIIDGLNQTSVNEPLCVGCSSDVASSVGIASSAHEPFRFVNGGIEKRNMRTGHRSASSPLVPSDDKHNVTCNYQYRTNANSVLDSSRDAHKSSCNSVDVQPENRPDCGRKTSSSRCTFSTETGKNFVRQRTRSEEESTVDCSMFDYDGTVDSDHELELGEHSRQIGTIDDPVTRGLNGVIGKRGNTGSEVAFNQQRLGEHSGNMTDFHSGLSDGSYGKSSLGQQGKIGLDFSVSENSIAANDKLTAEAEEGVDSELLVERSFQTHEDFNVRENLSSERKTFVSQSFPSSNDAGENSVAETDYSARTQPDKVLRSTSQSLIRAPKSYGAAAAERKAKRSDDCVSASTPAGAVRNSLLNSAQSKSASLHKTTKQQSREICTSKLPSSNASKLPASIAK